jgi:cystathionine beta-lyase/cystathionine gamma-synthase
MSGVIDEDGMYTRKTHEAQRKCSEKLRELYPGSLAVQIVPSGTAAIYTAVHGAIDIRKKKIKPTELILYASELYSETHRFFTELPNSHEVDITVAVDEPMMQLLTSIARHTPVIYFVETHSNPHGIRPNVDFLKFLAKQFQNLQVIFDNTMLTSARCNPFHEYREILDTHLMSVVCSASKHYSAGKTIAGFIAAGGRKHVSRILTIYRTVGYHVNPATCVHILASIETLHTRCEASSNHTSHLVTHLNKFIKSNEIMANIIYTEPTDVFVVRIKRDNVKKLNKFDLALLCTQPVQFVTSYGSADTRICNWVVIKDEYYSLRISVGYLFHEQESEIKKSLEYMISEVANSDKKSESEPTIET